MKITTIIEKLVLPIVVAVASVGATIFFTPDWEVTAREKGWISMPEWKTEAKSNGWGLREECPAYPVNIKLSSPGDGSIINSYQNGRSLDTSFIVKASREIRKESDVGFIIKRKNDTNVYVVFPYYDEYADRKVFSWLEIYTPIETKQHNKIEIKAIVTSNKKLFGSVYTSEEQIHKLDDEIVYSDQITVSIGEVK
jgi:hypothetical protein